MRLTYDAAFREARPAKARNPENKEQCDKARVPLGYRRLSSRFQARQWDRQQAFRGQHLDVALWESVPQEDLSGGC